MPPWHTRRTSSAVASAGSLKLAAMAQPGNAPPWNLFTRQVVSARISRFKSGWRRLWDSRKPLVFVRFPGSCTKMQSIFGTPKNLCFLWNPGGGVMRDIVKAREEFSLCFSQEKQLFNCFSSLNEERLLILTF